MTNAELIKALKDAEMYINYVAPACYAAVEAKEAIRAAADALEAAEKRIARLEEDLKTREAEREVMQDTIKVCEEAADRYKAQFPKEGEWLEANTRPRSAQFYCSVCHRTCYDIQPTRDKAWTKRCRYHYCPNCGAEMRTVTDCHTLDER